MGKFKIQKGLSDQDMFKNVKEEESFETAWLEEDAPSSKISKRVQTKSKEASQESFYREFLTEAVETEIGKALLAIKMEYFKEGVGDFFVHVKKDGKQIVLETGPKKIK